MHLKDMSNVHQSGCGQPAAPSDGQGTWWAGFGSGWASFWRLMRTKKKWRLPSCASAMQGTPMGMVHSSITLVTGLHATCEILRTAVSPPHLI